MYKSKEFELIKNEYRSLTVRVVGDFVYLSEVPTGQQGCTISLSGQDFENLVATVVGVYASADFPTQDGSASG